MVIIVLYVNDYKLSHFDLFQILSIPVLIHLCYTLKIKIL